MITVDPETSARDLRTIGRYPITCDNTPISKKIIGKIERVIYGRSTTTIKGFACNYTHNSPINIKVYAYGPPLRIDDPQSSLRGISYKTHSFLTQATSNQTSDEDIAFRCGKISTSGRRFSVTLNNSDLLRYNQHKFTVKGISNSGGTDSFIDSSYRYDVIPQKVEAYEIKK